jgi:hypothetical protein
VERVNRLRTGSLDRNNEARGGVGFVLRRLWLFGLSVHRLTSHAYTPGQSLGAQLRAIDDGPNIPPS